LANDNAGAAAGGTMKNEVTNVYLFECHRYYYRAYSDESPEKTELAEK